MSDEPRAGTVPATSIIRRQGSSRRIDVSAEVGDRPVADVAGDIGRQVRNVTFPFEYRSEVLGEYEERRSALRSIYSYSAAAAVLIFLLAQAALGSWTLAALSLIGAPIVVLGALIAAAISGGVLSLGSLLGMVTVLGLTVRQGIGIVSHFQALERDGRLPFGERLVLLGLGERFGSIVTTAITVMLVALPFAVLGDIAGLEIVWPIAVVILGGAVASTLNTLFVIPALYLRFGAGSGFDHLGLETKEVQ